MLSQHLALDIYKLYNLTYINKNSNELEISLIRNLLIKNSKEMLNANEILSTGKSSNKTIYTLSNNIYNIYFGDMNLAFKVINYNKIVESALNSKMKKIF